MNRKDQVMRKNRGHKGLCSRWMGILIALLLGGALLVTNALAAKVDIKKSNDKEIVLTLENQEFLHLIIVPGSYYDFYSQIHPKTSALLDSVKNGLLTTPELSPGDKEDTLFLKRLSLIQVFY